MNKIIPSALRGVYSTIAYVAFVLLSSTALHAQNPAPSGDYTFTSQADLDAFFDAEGQYTNVTGNLTIDATGTITDLSNLALLEDIIGTLTIINYGVDETVGDPLSAMQSLTSVDQLLIGQVPAA